LGLQKKLRIAYLFVFPSMFFFVLTFKNQHRSNPNKVVPNLLFIKKKCFVNKLTAGKKKLSAQNYSFRKTFL